MKKSRVNPKIVITVGVVLIVLLAAVALVPVLWAAIAGPGVKTGPLDASDAEPATTDINGTWQVTPGTPPNTSSVGFTFDEILPNEERSTSGSTQGVSGSVVVEEGQITAGEIIVDMTNVVTDRDVRDESVRNKLFETSRFPTAAFHITDPVDVSHVPDDGTAVPVELTGDLTIKGHTHEITHTFDALRDGDSIVISGSPVIDRNDYGVESPEMIAAKIADEGTIDLRLSFRKDH
ncbi:YceI family protein [Corynebacterium doosanense]|uniref:Lipid/polyisoprenoid-binding YceI-like domain-containing protein n=1 Tax=Corynebacterium doosanense CAU 212 = DSM 45436 TaxID=558173 RepID=A0A097IG09_9CORY|nr:YceI family protein [Corynebacterium doosanense]AIT61066.1 hypothetical protein CDOO_07230 [Corynebacterium doosanense CAU 212 = DSM 45436]